MTRPRLLEPARAPCGKPACRRPGDACAGCPHLSTGGCRCIARDRTVTAGRAL